MKTRRPKVVTKDFRPPGVGARSPVGGGNSQPRAAASPDRFDLYAGRYAKDAAEHDKAIEGLSVETLLAISKDLGARHAYDRRDNEHRWIMGRLAAVLRKLSTLASR